MANQPITANRRLFLGGGALVAAAAATVSIPTIAIAAAAPSRAAWNVALTDLARADAAYEATHDPFEIAENLYRSSRPKYPTDEELLTPSSNPAEPFENIIARGYATKADWKRRDDLAKHESGWTKADLAQATACTGTTIALKALMACPAPDLAAVTYKIDLAIKEGIEVDNIAPVLADLRRLSGGAA